jgi:fumarate reductase flavoprotein subunit
MGGVRTDADGAAYGLKGLFSAGEAACWDLHGFNRLGGNSLAETIVAGKIVGEKVSRYLEGTEVSFSTRLARETVTRQHERIGRITRRVGGESVHDLRREMEKTLMERVPIFRNADDLQFAMDTLATLLERSRRLGLQGRKGLSSPELTAALRLPGMLRLALSIAFGAQQRTESRGSHFREDFPFRDDNRWLKRTLAYWPEDAELPRLEYEDVTITELPPGDRGYGEASELGD